MKHLPMKYGKWNQSEIDPDGGRGLGQDIKYKNGEDGRRLT